MKKGKRVDGSWRYDKQCLRHHRIRFDMPIFTRDYARQEVYKYTKRPCNRCGWGESFCDLHRIIPGKDGGKYVKDNVEVLCPNCHRIEHRGSFT